MDTTSTSHPTDPLAESADRRLAKLIAGRLGTITPEELGALGRPNTPGARFLRVQGDSFIYQVRGKRVAACDAQAAQAALKKAQLHPKDSPERAARMEEVEKFFNKEMCLSRKTVMANAARRIVERIDADQPEPELEPA